MIVKEKENNRQKIDKMEKNNLIIYLFHFCLYKLIQSLLLYCLVATCNKLFSGALAVTKQQKSLKLLCVCMIFFFFIDNLSCVCAIFYIFLHTYTMQHNDKFVYNNKILCWKFHNWRIKKKKKSPNKRKRNTVKIKKMYVFWCEQNNDGENGYWKVNELLMMLGVWSSWRWEN